MNSGRSQPAHCQPELELSFWRAGKIEVDFILGNMEVGLEAKASARIHSDHLKGLRELKKDYPKIKRRLVICLENQSRVTDDGIEVLPYREFVKQLWQNNLI